MNALKINNIPFRISFSGNEKYALISNVIFIRKYAAIYICIF